MTENELVHFGIKGMKWGVRRYQNKDGTLTPAGKKRISKKYKKSSTKAASTLQRNYQKMYIDSYNKAADYMNSEGINKFNSSQKKRYGSGYANRSGYEDDYMSFFDDTLTKIMNQSLNDFYRTNPDVQVARDLVKKYDMTKWDDLAKKNEAAIEEVRKAVQQNRR